MDTNEIETILSRNSHTKNSFKGVYARNRLPRRLRYPCSLVANTDPDTFRGTHWIAIYIDQNRQGEYYDPMGIPPFHAAFENFMHKHCHSWKYNEVQVQYPATTVCGQHCIFYLIHRCTGKSMMDITSALRTDVYGNTFIVDDFLQYQKLLL